MITLFKAVLLNIMSKSKKSKSEETGTPKYPYTTMPQSLRRLLEIIPTKPKPPKVNGNTLKIWGFKNTNEQSMLRVLKALSLLTNNGDTTEGYASFMRKDIGASVLGKLLQDTYVELFENVANPGTATNDDLVSFFNIHSGGSEKTIKMQIETFKALASHATFGKTDPLEQPVGSTSISTVAPETRGSSDPVIRIDLHIHLPENKTKGEYDAIMESIATHLYKRSHE